MVLITIATGATLNQLITGGPHIAWYIDTYNYGIKQQTELGTTWW